MILEEISSLLLDSIKAAIVGSRRLRIVFFVAWGLILIAIALAGISEGLRLHRPLLQPVAAALGISGGLIILGLGAFRRALASTERERQIEEVEERARQHPREPQAAWDLARVKLESYLNRNLRQVQWIFFLTLLVMTVGFVIIGYGVMKAYESPDNFKPSVIVTSSGVVVEFIAATFLVIYRSTMEQARSYVTMLEKINAVGMSIHILDSTKNEDVDKFRVQLAMELLTLYGAEKTRVGTDQ
jgi:uncharacterized membrane protein